MAARILSVFLNVRVESGAHPASYTMKIVDYFLGDKAAGT
jgi:hypothetical protein